MKSFHLVKEAKTDVSRGYGFCEYADENGLGNALKYLNGMKVGSRNITVKRTNASTTFVMPSEKMSEEERKNFESKIDDFIYNTGKFVGITSVAEG